MERIVDRRDFVQGRLVQSSPPLICGWQEEALLGDRLEDIERSVGLSEGHTLTVWKKTNVAAEPRGYQNARRRAFNRCMAPGMFCISLCTAHLAWKQLNDHFNEVGL